MPAGRVLAIAAAAALALACPNRAAADVADFLGRRIVGVRLAVEGRSVPDARLSAVIQTRVGDPLSMGDVRESLIHLFSFGRFESIAVHAEAERDGVALLYALVPVHPTASVRLTGDLSGDDVDEGRIRSAIGERYGSLPSAGRAGEVAAFIHDHLRELGYVQARVEAHVETHHDPHRADLVFALEPGARARIGSVRVNGDAGVPPPELLRQLDLAPGVPYRREALSARVDRFIEGRRARGYYNASLVVVPELVDGARIVNLELNVAQGPRVRVVFRGDALPGSRRDELVPVAREGSTDQDLLEDATNNIESYLRSQGYRDATAAFSSEEANGELVITFTVTRGPLYRVARIDLIGEPSQVFAELQSGLRSREGRPFSVASLDADVGAIEDVYRRQGYALVEVQTDVQVLTERPSGATVPVSVGIRIIENVRTQVASVTFRGNDSIPADVLLPQLGLRPGAPFFLTQMAMDRDAVQMQYANLGFLSATVEGNPGVSADGSRADVVFTVREGPQLRVGHVLIVGVDRTRPDTIERELQLKSGDPLGLAAVTESQRRLAALGLFRRARIAQLGHGRETERDLLVSIEEAPATTAAYGGGVEAGRGFVQTGEGTGVATERLEIAPRAFVELGRRNLFGKNRSVNLFAGISILRRLGSDATPTPAFNEYRMLGTFREPRVFATAADAVLTGTVEQQRRSSFNFRRQAFGAEAGRRLSNNVSASGSYEIQRTSIFNEQIDPDERLLVDRLFPQLRLSSVTMSGVFDTRDDPLDPSGGHYASGSMQLAARRLGSEVGFVKSYFTAQLFRTVPRTRGVVFVGNTRVGLASGFPRDVLRPQETPAVVDEFADLPASERFFAGGDTTVRGFLLDQLGPRQDGFPFGGNALVILNAELRVPVAWGLGVVSFFDTGNVFARTTEIDVSDLRRAVGFGVRYKSPVGPLRFDVGFNIHRREFTPGRLEPLTAIHISLGQAF
jgi:outer membrane protein assembly factor BamA